MATPGAWQAGDPGHPAEHNRQYFTEQVPTAALKYHRVTPLVLPAPDVWTPVPWETGPASEQLPGLTLDADDITIVSEVRDIMWVSGCVRPRRPGPDNTTAVVATRIVTSEAPGEPFVENRCLQAIQSRQRQSQETGTFHYMGTVGCEIGPGSGWRSASTTSGWSCRGPTSSTARCRSASRRTGWAVRLMSRRASVARSGRVSGDPQSTVDAMQETT